MARRVRDTVLDNRTARDRLPAQREPHWRAVAQGLHVGYRKGKRDRTWVARQYDSKSGKYTFNSLGVADDHLDADGERILSFGQAQEAARDWSREGVEKRSGPYTVSNAIDDYLIEYRKHGKSEQDISYRINAFIIPAFKDTEVEDITHDKITRWHTALASAAARVRTRKGNKQNVRLHDGEDDDAVRRRRHTANKVLTILKAALNHAFTRRKVASDHEWRSVKPFKGVDRPRIRFPVDEQEPVRVANGTDPEFRPLVQGALLSGARYGELIALTTRDYTPKQGLLYIAPGKTKYGRHVVLTDEGTTFFESLTVGRDPDELIFRREDGSAWGKSHQGRRMKAACDAAKILPPVSFHILRHWYAAALVKAGVPLSIVAENLGHQDPKITMRHYGHLAPGQKAEVIRALAPALGLVDVNAPSNTRRLN